MTYPEAIQYLESLVNYEKFTNWPYKESLKLERFNDFLQIIDNPQESLRCIHVAGTKGKGSTCAFVTYILRQAGYKVGLYTSPHLSDFRERIRILERQSARAPERQQERDFEGMISQRELTDLTEDLRPAIEKYNRTSEYGPLSFFEAYTCLAFVYFKEKKTDFAVLETGLGGRLDATNVVNPYVCAITSLSYEHTQKLGSSLREIAREKAGIIKGQQFSGSVGHQAIVVMAPQEEEAAEVIRNRCEEAGAKLYEVGKDILYYKGRGDFKVDGLCGEYAGLKTKLIGAHQIINASTAIGAIEALRWHNIKVGIDSIRGGIYNTVWPGRCEALSKNPLVILDGAQNVASAGALKETIKENFFAFGKKCKRLVLVLGISSDKDIKGVCNQLYDLADAVVLTQANNPRAEKPEAMAEYFGGKQIHLTGNVREAMQQALGIAGKEGLILVTGSLFVVGEARELYDNKT